LLWKLATPLAAVLSAILLADESTVLPSSSEFVFPVYKHVLLLSTKEMVEGNQRTSQEIRTEYVKFAFLNNGPFNR